MMEPTHFTLGIATALAITHPRTVPGIVAAIVGGGVGAILPDIDIKGNVTVTKRRIYDRIICLIFIGVTILLDFIWGDGMCEYVASQWNVPVKMALLSLIILYVIGLNSGHRKFTHSILGAVLYSGLMYIFCRPIFLSFVTGYLSHMLIDLFNKKGEQLFWPIKWYPRFNLCESNGKTNQVLFWICLVFDFIFGSTVFVIAFIHTGNPSGAILKMQTAKFIGLNVFQIYLISINVITFLGFQRSWKKSLDDYYQDNEEGEEFSTWLLNILVFMGGGIGMLVALIIHLQIPVGYNANWWSFMYTSLLAWFTAYSYICNPFGCEVNSYIFSLKNHLFLIVYSIVINTISALTFYIVRNKRFREDSFAHTGLLALDMLGGTLGGMLMVLFTKHRIKYNYATVGFPVMLCSQIVFTLYMIMAGIF
ncbi:MAG: metal-dependent hydrolase [Bulleidia sp.]|nr:metal-dependent hydrolase [Bulleidia sp.]